VKSPLFVAVVLGATSLGVIAPVLKGSGNIDSSFGQLVITAASIADFGSIIPLSLFSSGNGSTTTAGRLILLGVFGLVVVLVGVAVASVERCHRPWLDGFRDRPTGLPDELGDVGGVRGRRPRTTALPLSDRVPPNPL
jgi:Kef-type K+ transport system membrane component KefB